MSESVPDTTAPHGPYRLNPIVELHWRQFDGDWVLFEATSGQTHQLTAITAAVLMCYEASPQLAVAELLDALRAEFGLSIDPSRKASLLAEVDQLAALGLVIPAALADAAV